MARRMTKAGSKAIGLLIILGLIGAGAPKLFEAVGLIVPAIVVTIVVVLYSWHKSNKKKKRLEYLRAKYKDEEIVQKIMGAYFWQGQTKEQLEDSLGAPIDIDTNVLKTKKKEVWKYQHQGGNHFRLRIMLENDVVVGWDQKA